MNEDILRIVYGKNKLEKIVSCELNDGYVELFIENDTGIERIIKPAYYWILMDKEYGPGCIRLKGNQTFKYLKKFKTYEEFYKARSWFYNNRHVKHYSIPDKKEMAMVYYGFTYFKGLKVDDVSILSFDIETTGITHNENSKILLISNTYRNKNKLIKKLFAYDEYNSQAEMINAWCDWVKTVNPSILVGHNIFTFDLPYLIYVASKEGVKLSLGRDDSDIFVDTKPSKFRKDGSQFYEYYRHSIYGREIIDTMFLAYKYDVSRKYESYGLKNIIKHEGLEKKDRQFYDAGKIQKLYKNKEEWEKIKQYCLDDSEDSLKLYDLMIPSFFYMTQSIPKSFQAMILGATGSQLNSLMVRSYLQDEYSIPEASEVSEYQGAISFGEPGIYHNLIKSDVTSLYPSIMLQYDICDTKKDPQHNFTKILKYFRESRIKNKKLAKETGDKYYDDLQSGEKIVINSLYGFMGAPGLNYNSPENAALVTKYGREVLQKSIDWAKSKGFIVPGGDTDSILYGHPDSKPFTEQQIKDLLNDLNSQYPEYIKFEDDGYFKTVIILKAKNYVLYDGKKVKIKGSALKATTKEIALREFIEKTLKCLLDGNTVLDVKYIYDAYAIEATRVNDISRWASKKTITDAILNPKRSNERKILDAIGNRYFQEGDKIYVFFREDQSLCLVEDFNGDYCIDTLLDKLFKTVKIFDTILDIKLFPNYSLKKNKIMLKNMILNVNQRQ